MIVSRCAKCGEEKRDFGRQAIVTVEQYTDTGMTVTRRILCDQHTSELLDWLDDDEEELRKTAGRGTD